MAYVTEPMYNQETKTRSDLIFENHWANGLCECCTDCRACLCACFCPCCFACEFDKSAKECCCTTIGLGILGFQLIPICMYRSKLRGAYKIDGSIIEDVCLSYWCGFCAILQMYNEMKYRGDAE